MKKLFVVISAVALFVTLSSFVLAGKTCPNCNSTNTSTTIVEVSKKCPGCNGTGKQLDKKCTTCKGNKTVTEPKTGHKCKNCGNVWL